MQTMINPYLLLLWQHHYHKDCKSSSHGISSMQLGHVSAKETTQSKMQHLLELINAILTFKFSGLIIVPGVHIIGPSDLSSITYNKKFSLNL